MRTLVLILLFVAVPLASGTLRPEQESEFWKDTGLDMAYFSKAISTESCQTSKRAHHACLSALYEGAQLSGESKAYKQARNIKHPAPIPVKEIVQKMLAKTTLPQPMLLGRMLTAYMRVFDHFAQIMPEAYFQLLLNGQSKTYYGLGTETIASAAGLHVFRVYPGSAAQKAGLRVHDRIVSVNGRTARDLTEAKALASNMTSGKKDELLKISIERGGELLDLEALTSVRVVSDIQEERIQIDGKLFVYLRLLRFGLDSCLNIQNRLEGLRAVQLGGLVLDLRQNYGGSVGEGECVARLFLGDVPVMKRTMIESELPHPFKFDPGELTDYSGYFPWRQGASDVPLTVLIDADSASMSEVVAGSLQGYGRAMVVGETSFGKSGTQKGMLLPELPKLRLMRTVSKFELPDEIRTQEVGVTPNIEVPFAFGASKQMRTFEREVYRPRPPRAQAFEANADFQDCLLLKYRDSSSRQTVEATFGFADEQLSTALSVLRCRPNET